MGKPKAPKPTPATETSAAQTGTNVGTAIANAFLQNPTEYTPDGSTQVNQTGTYKYNDTYTGQSYDIPTFTRTTTLSPQQQAIKTQTDAAQLSMGALAAEQSSKLQKYLSEPVDLSNEATEARLMELGQKRLDPLLAQRREAEETRLANQGVRLGSTAYDRANANIGQTENDAYNSLLLQGRGQAVQEALAQRNQPINEITALLSGSQVSQPNFMGANLSAIPTTDNAGIIANVDNQKMQGYQQQMANYNGIMGGLFGLGRKLIGLSDETAKKDKTRIMDLDDDGTGLWAFRYKGENNNEPKHIGLMAQEVEKIAPEAVLDGYDDGYKRVDYGRAISRIIGGA